MKMNFGQLLKHYREAKGITIEQMAESLPKYPNPLHSYDWYESGMQAPPDSKRHIERLTALMELKPDEILRLCCESMKYHKQKLQDRLGISL